MTDATGERALDRAWEERGWPRELLERGRALSIPDSQFENILSWNATIERAELEVEWTEKVLRGTIRWRQVTVTDGDAFRELWLHAPEEIGEWDVTHRRGPNAFAQFEIQERPVLNALFDGPLMVACVSFSLRYTLVGGRRLAVRFGQAMRVHRDHRRHGYGNWVRSLPWAIGIGMPTEVQYDFIRARNMLMERWNRTHMPNVESVPKQDGAVPGVPVSVLQYPARAVATNPAVRLARETDLEACAVLINHTHAGRDLFVPVTASALAERLHRPFIPPWASTTPVYSFDDFYVYERDGRVVACGGAWDRGRDVVEQWRHRDSGEERQITTMSVLDFGYEAGEAAAMALLIETWMTLAEARGRDFVVAPIDAFADVQDALSSHAPVVETRYLQWRTDDPPLSHPFHLDLRYW